MKKLAKGIWQYFALALRWYANVPDGLAEWKSDYKDIH